jgi:hypothetical protein
MPSSCMLLLFAFAGKGIERGSADTVSGGYSLRDMLTIYASRLPSIGRWTVPRSGAKDEMVRIRGYTSTRNDR